jgi:hypothetical protein
MVRALLAGTKTQTRRAVKPRPEESPEGNLCGAWLSRPLGGLLLPKVSDIATHCPYGQAGDRLWVREAFSGPWCMEAQDGCAAVPPSKWGEGSRIWYWADGDPTYGDWTRPRPSIHMPRWASRILLEITAVRVERLQDISEVDARAEGIQELIDAGVGHDGSPIDTYRALWDGINGEGAWALNPWVWVVEFRRIA